MYVALAIRSDTYCIDHDFARQAQSFSVRFSKKHVCIVLEDIEIHILTRSAKSIVKEHGKNVKARLGLNRAILDQGWGEFARQVGYMLAWRFGMIVLVPSAYTSQKCSCCGHIEEANRKAEKFCCLQCGHAENADVNAARNIETARGCLSCLCSDHTTYSSVMRAVRRSCRSLLQPRRILGLDYVHQDAMVILRSLLIPGISNTDSVDFVGPVECMQDK